MESRGGGHEASTAAAMEGERMLVLARKVNESIVIGEAQQIEIQVVEICGDKVKLGITAPDEVPIHRQEVVDALLAKGEPIVSLARSQQPVPGGKP